MAMGTIIIDTTTGGGTIPVAGVSFAIKDKQGNVLHSGITDTNGVSEVFSLPAPPRELSQTPNSNIRPYSVYDIWLGLPNFATVNKIDVPVFDGQQTIVPVDMVPLAPGQDQEITIVTPPPTAAVPTPPQLQVGTNEVLGPDGQPLPGQSLDGVPALARLLPAVVVPEYITVHLGVPGNTAASNVRVRFIDYVKNVTSSEIFPTWPTNSIIANVHAIVTFALNRIYTEWYRARGFPFDITNSTAFDQYFVPGREIFQNISQIVDGIFNVYARRAGFRNPYFTEYCSGSNVTCRGMSQWGTVTLANQDLTPLQILRHYYPNDLELAIAPTSNVIESYPGAPLAVGSSGEAVRRMQNNLNRIRVNFPLIPQITNPNGVFGPDTQEAVRVFQRTFNLVQDGIVGRSTWNKISQVFVAVARLAELDSEGERIGLSPTATPPSTVLRQGSRGDDVLLLQFILSYLGQFFPDIPFVIQDSLFGTSTADAVRAFQRREGIAVDGVVGPITWSRLFSAYRTVQGQSPTVPPVTPPPIIPPARPPFPGFLLRRGSTGDAVRTLQTLLNNARIKYPAVPVVAVDGIFGPLTENSVRIFQLFAGLAVDGIVGPITWAALTAI